MVAVGAHLGYYANRTIVVRLHEDVIGPARAKGYGTDDAFAGANALLADALPQGRVFKQKGGHDWPVWKRLWSDFLERAPLVGDAGAGSRALP